MGAGHSLNDRQDVEDDEVGVDIDGGHGVIKRIPIEVKPRGRLGLGQGVRSLSKPKGSSSLRSALSVDVAEYPEVERVQKEFDMYRMNRDNEVANMIKKEQKLETENRKLRAELQTLQKTCKKQRDERDSALEAEHRALTRAAAIEADRDKIQRQFKIFRETKESELQNLLRAKRDLESKLVKLGGASGMEDSESISRLEIGFSNLGDWWTAVDSEPSLSGTSRLHNGNVNYRGPEFANTVDELDGPYITINKEDWRTATASLLSGQRLVAMPLQSCVIRVYLTSTSDMAKDASRLHEICTSKLRPLCSSSGQFLDIVSMLNIDDDSSASHDHYLQSRYWQIDRCCIFIALVGAELCGFIETDINYYIQKYSSEKRAVFCLKNLEERATEQRSGFDVTIKKLCDQCDKVKLVTEPVDTDFFADQTYQVVRTLVEQDLSTDIKSGFSESPSSLVDDAADTNTSLLGCVVCDVYQEREQLEALIHASQSTSALGFEKYYARLNAHVSAAGPLPPLLVHGSPGSGKSLLLAKWISQQQYKASGSLVLYHFVGNSTSSSSDPTLMIRRLTAQLMRHVTCPPGLTSDPAHLVAEFPKWLEKVSSRMPSGIILVIDSVDHFQKCESLLSWLADPLPVDLRVILSTRPDTCPQTWKSWPSLVIADLNIVTVREMLQREIKMRSVSLSPDHENRIVAHFTLYPLTQCPLYIVLLAAFLARNQVTDSNIDSVLKTSSSIELYCVMLQLIVKDCNNVVPSGGGSVVVKVLCLVYASHNGISEMELFDLVPSLQWSHWSLLCHVLVDWHILSYLSGLLVFAHEQARQAASNVILSNFDGNSLLRDTRLQLCAYFNQSERHITLMHRSADELPWLYWQLEDSEKLKESLQCLSIFVNLYARGHCAELTSYWHHLGADKSKIAQAYITATKQKIFSVNGVLSPPDVADVCELLGKYLAELNLLNENYEMLLDPYKSVGMALTLLQRSLEIRETSLDPDHPSVARSLHQIADLHAQQGKLSTAENLYRQALEIYEGSLGRDHPLVGKELATLSMMYQKQGKHEIADPLYRRAVAIRQKNSRSVSTLAASKVSTKHGDNLVTQILQTVELENGSNSVETARTLNEIGVLHYLQNDTTTAELFLKRSLEMREQLLIPNHPDIAQSLNNLAALYHDLSQYNQAMPLYERALDIRQKHYPLEHPYVALLLKNLGLLCKKTGLLEKAVTYYSSLVESKERRFGVTHPSLATALVNLAVLHSQQGEHDLAEPLFSRALKIYEDTLDPCHPRVAETLRNMAVLKYEQGDLEMAAQLYKRCTEMRCSEPSTVGYDLNKTLSTRSCSSSIGSRTTVCQPRSSVCD